MSEHVHSYERYGDHGPDDYGDPLATYCPGCGRLRDDIESAEADARAVACDVAIEAEARALLLDELEAAVRTVKAHPETIEACLRELGSPGDRREAIVWSATQGYLTLARLIQQHREAIR